MPIGPHTFWVPHSSQQFRDEWVPDVGRAINIFLVAIRV
jgi:hypothetical protein